MTTTLTAMSWNVQGEIGISESRMQRQLDFLDTHTTDIDLFLLQAVHYESDSSGTWHGQLGTLLDYFSTRGFHVTHTGDWAQELRDSTVQPHANITGSHNRCNLIASRWPVDRRPLSLRNQGDRKPRQLNYYYSHFPEKLLVGQIDLRQAANFPADTVETWNVGIINGANWGEEKLNMLETVYGRIYLQTSKTGTPVLLGGDFNAPKRETASGEIIPHGQNAAKYTHYPFYGEPYCLKEENQVGEFRFDQRQQRAEAYLFDQTVSEWHMRDTYWAAETGRKESSIEDFTHTIETATPARKRLDHVLVSEQFDVHRCELWNGIGTTVDGLGPSDHAPVVADVELAV
jgi:endonuclease/exonuclease/phosphatase family metal-dependent hydrolase